MKHLPPQSHKRPVYTDHLPVVQSHNKEPHNQLSHRLLANMQHWQWKEIACTSMCVCVEERDTRVPFSACAHMCLCFLANVAICMCLWLFLCLALVLVVPGITHPWWHWSILIALSVSLCFLKQYRRWAKDAERSDNVCLCVLEGRIIDLCLCKDEHVTPHWQCFYNFCLLKNDTSKTCF